MCKNFYMCVYLIFDLRKNYFYFISHWKIESPMCEVTYCSKGPGTGDGFTKKPVVQGPVGSVIYIVDNRTRFRARERRYESAIRYFNSKG